MPDEDILRLLRLPRHEGLQQRNAEAPPKIAHEVEDACCHTCLFRAQITQSGHRKRDENQCDRDPGQGNRKHQLAHSDLQVDTSEQDDRQGHQPKARNDEIARADNAHETSSQQRSYEGTDAAGTQRQSRIGRAIAKQILHEERQDGRGAVEQRSEQGDQAGADRKISIQENAQIHQRVCAVSSRARKATKANAEIVTDQLIVAEPNQSSSWPRSRTYWSVASQSVKNAKPM